MFEFLRTKPNRATKIVIEFIENSDPKRWEIGQFLARYDKKFILYLGGRPYNDMNYAFGNTAVFTDNMGIVPKRKQAKFIRKAFDEIASKKALTLIESNRNISGVKKI